MPINKEFILKTAERMVKTFFQFYFGFWLITAGFISTTAITLNPDAFDVLFTMDNFKVGIVGLALSLATSIGTKNLGPNKEDPSIV